MDPETDPKFDHYAETLFKLREKKGMTLEKATATLKSDLITYGVMMVKEGDADGLVAGACHATADTLRPALQILKTAPGTELVFPVSSLWTFPTANTAPTVPSCLQTAA